MLAMSASVLYLHFVQLTKRIQDENGYNKYPHHVYSAAFTSSKWKHNSRHSFTIYLGVFTETSVTNMYNIYNSFRLQRS